MRIVVTGGTGFIGRHFITAAADDHEVICLVRRPGRPGVDARVATIEGDLYNPDCLSSLPDRADAIVHLAQANVHFPEEANQLFTVNTTSTQLLADYARRSNVRHFVYASSGNVYARSVEPLKETDILDPIDFYGMTKRFSEDILRCYEPFFNVTILRLFSPYGLGQANRMIANIIDRVRRGQTVTLHNEGEPRTNPVYVADVVETLKLALVLTGYHVVNIAGPRVVSVRDIAVAAGEALGTTPLFAYQRESTSWNLIADTAKMSELFTVNPLLDPSQGIRLATATELQ